MHESVSCSCGRVVCKEVNGRSGAASDLASASRQAEISGSQPCNNFRVRGEAFVSYLGADLWPLTSGPAYSTLISLQRKRYLFVCINRRAEDNPKGCCATRHSEEVYKALKEEVAARGLAKLEARVCTSSCLDQCATGVTVLVEPDHFSYGGVTVADIQEIVDGLISGQPVKRLVVTGDQHQA
jgi:(2Fe-2S) ferredoxin